MTDTGKGILAMIGAAGIWGISPIYYKLLAHIPAPEVMAHRTFWSLVFFAGVLAYQGRLGDMGLVLRNPRRFGLIVLASLMVSTNWFLFIYATQIDRNTETSLGYYIYPLVAVLVGRFAFGERLGGAQWLSVALAAGAVAVLALGLGSLPWISLTLATTFALYGVIKKLLPVGPIVSVTCEVLIAVPIALAVVFWLYMNGAVSPSYSVGDAVLLVASGPTTAFPLILFTIAARRVPMATVGLLQYLNPTLQFLCAVVLFGEVFTPYHQIAFPMIWIALAVYSVATLRHDRATRRASMAVVGVSTQVMKSASDPSAKP
ncbi:EamA family transporter RarD [Sedimentitalea todarodis]|uniref:EamA family transporter RarD n=1 Tax=Sedimentitalea todarodis TaxID=1631240 RepID=A0ABU3VBR6_9RHOB|nr:EamA family transporter RarD [Sedimentitalea todarodis]MDU9003612.1 EamA family transporter RarD [Sedimentitalea todarodis]